MNGAQRTAVVIGASGGIGRALLEQLATDDRFDAVVGLSRRRPADAASRPWIWHEADILDEASLASAASAAARYGRPARVIVATGVLHGPGMAPEKNMQSMTLSNLSHSFAINAAGPALVAKCFLPTMTKTEPSVFAALSARVGSISDNALGGWYAYRASKAALNMLVRSLAIEHRRSHPLGACVALHPGTVDTPLSEPFQRNVPAGALLTPSQSASRLLKVIEALGPEDTGGFFAWNAERLPW